MLQDATAARMVVFSTLHLKCDIKMIQETWYTNEIMADGFSSSVLEAEEERGRLKGDFGILVSTTLNISPV